MASLFLGKLGSSLAGPLGGLLGSALGGAIDTFLFSPVQEGPQLDDLSVTRASPGVPIPLVYGADRLAGTLMASSDLIETVDEYKTGGFLGIGGQRVKEYKYSITAAFLLCEGPIMGVGRIWADNKIIRGIRKDKDAEHGYHGNFYVSAEDFPLHIGAMAYGSWYRSHLMHPSVAPWTLDREIVDPNYVDETTGLYKKLPSMTEMRPVTPAEAEAIISKNPAKVAKDILYWKMDDQYYIPINNRDHEYNGKRVKDSIARTLLDEEDLIIQGIGLGADPVSAEFEATFFDNSYSVVWQEKVVDLGTEIYSGSVTINLSQTVSAAFPNLTGGQSNFDVELHPEGDDVIVNGVEMGPGAGGPYSVSLEVPQLDALSANQQTTFYETFDIPQTPNHKGVRYVVFRMKASMTFPVFATTVLEGNATFVPGGSGGGGYERKGYWNLYDAINDWGPQSAFQFLGPDDVYVYYGTYDQQPCPALQSDVIKGVDEEHTTDIPAYVNRAYIVFENMPLGDFGNRLPNFQFEIVHYDDDTVMDVLEDMSSRAGLAPQYYDTSDLENNTVEDNFVMGYAITRKTNYRKAMETFMEAFRVDAAEIGDSIEYRRKTRYYDYEIEWTDLAALEAGSRRLDSRMSLTMRDRMELPKHLNIVYKDPERNYQENEAQFRRQSTVAISDTQSTIATVLAPSRAKRYARDKMRDIWLERVSGTIKLPHKHVKLFPTDIIKVNGSEYGYDDFTLKITSATRGANGMIEIEAVMQSSTLYVPLDGETDDVGTDNPFGPTGAPSNSLEDTVLVVKDLPPILELDSQYNVENGVYFFTGSPGIAWNGAAVYEYEGVYNVAGDDYEKIFTTLERFKIGKVMAAALLDRPAEVIDWDSAVRVQPYNSADVLQSITPELLFEGGNMAIMGNEVVQFLNVELIDADLPLYELTGFLRGRRGTYQESVLSGHTVGEDFVLLDRYPLNYLDDSPSFTRAYDALSFGDDDPRITNGELDEAEVLTLTGKRVTPLAPTQISGTRDGSNNLTITWNRNDRYYQKWPDGTDIENSETLEQYIVSVADLDTPTRTFTVDDATEVEYTAADQTTDGYTPGDTITVYVQQVSSLVGAGNAGSAVV